MIEFAFVLVNEIIELMVDVKEELAEEEPMAF
jgi:hypothetical protein